MPVKNRKNRLEISYIGYAKYSQVIGATKVFRIELRSKTQLKTVTVTGKQRVKSNGCLFYFRIRYFAMNFLAALVVAQSLS